jgi:hypothetical protein
MTNAKKSDGANLYRIPADNLWANAWKIAAVLAVVGAAGAFVGASSDPNRFAFSYLFAFFAGLTVALGSVFFVILQFLTIGGWSISMRRIAELFAAGIPVFALLFVPVWMNADVLYEWSTHESHGAEHEEAGHEEGEGADAEEGGEEHGSGESLIGASTALAQEHAPAGEPAAGGEHAEGAAAHHSPQHQLHTELLDHKHGYMKLGGAFGWVVRALIYFALWIFLALFYFRESTQQDEDKDMGHTRKMQSLAPIGMIIFGLSLTFAAFDWVMSLEPTWYSTIYGVYVFAGAAIAVHALIIVVTLGLKSRGILGDAVNVEHYHSLGKMLFGFIVFHAYVGFSQMMLQWYANIPEEIAYYHARWHAAGWKGVSYFLIFGHFALPFLFLISRVVKRRLPLIAFGAMWMLIMQMVDVYWFVMPNAAATFSPHWLDIACLLLVGGVYGGVVLFMMRRFNLVAIGDPRLSRALSHLDY